MYIATSHFRFFCFILACCSFTVGCTFKKNCYRDFISNNRFANVSPQGNIGGNVILFKDGSQFEYVNGKLEHSSDVIWKSCSTYLLISKNTSGGGFWQPGDTLTVKVVKRVQDTLTVLASARGASFEMQMVRVIE